MYKPNSRLILFGIALFVSSACLALAQQKSDAVSRILALEAKWNDAYKANDIAAMNSLLADDFIITVEDGSTYSKSGYIANAGNGALHVEISEMSNLKVNLHGNVAIVTGVYHEKGTLHEKPYQYHDRFTDVWVNADGKWQILASHYAIPVK